MKKIITILALLFALISATNLLAQNDILNFFLLKNGDVYKGEVIKINNEFVEIKTQDSIYSIPKKDIETVEIDEQSINQYITNKTMNNDNITNINYLEGNQHITNMNYYMQGIPYRNAGIATFMSMTIPGGGQFYNNQSLKGIGFVLWAGASVGLMTYGFNMSDYKIVSGQYGYSSRSIDNTETKNVIIIVAGVSYLASWIISMIDANMSSKSINKKYLGRFDLGNNKHLSINPDYRLVKMNKQTTQTLGLNLSLNF